MDGAAGPENGRFYYGWLVLGAGAICEMLAIGATSYAAGFFVLPLQKEFHLSRADASTPVLLVYLGAVFVAPYAGRIIDRYPMRWTVSAGAFLFAAALALISVLSSLWLMALLLVLPAAAGFMLYGPLTTATLASRWFYRRRGLAQGIAAIALSGGGLIVAPLLGKAIQAQGWRMALAEEAAAIFMIVTALALLVLKDNPVSAGLAEHKENKGRGDAAALRDAHADLPQFQGWRNILGKAGIWAPSLMIATATSVGETIVVAVPPYGLQLGIPIAPLTALISAFALASALAKILAGALADYWDKRILLFVAAAGMPVSLAILSWFSGYPALLTACCFAGVATGGILPTASSLISARFGAARFGTIMGWSYAMIGAATILAVEFSARVYDLTGGYHAAFVGLLAFSLVLMLVSVLIDLRLPGKNA